MSFIGKTVKFSAIDVAGLVGIAAIGESLMTPEEKAERLAKRIDACVAEVGKTNCDDRGYKTDEYYAAEKAHAEARAAELEKERKEQAEIAFAENKRKGFHCLSSWDGSHRTVKNWTVENLKDPESFDHIETKVTPVNDKGEHTLIMKYRARNGFGGMSIGSVVATYKTDCSATIVSSS